MAITTNAYAPNEQKRKLREIISELMRKRGDANFVRYALDREGYDSGIVDEELQRYQSFKTGQPYQEENKTGQPYQEENAAVGVLKEKLSGIDSLLSDTKGLDASVGTGMFDRGVDLPYGIYTNPDRSRFSAGAAQVVSQESLQSLIDAKAQGATFGALSDQELRILQQAATKLGQWAITDDSGKITGFNADETEVKKELNRLRGYLVQGLESAGSTVSGEVQKDSQQLIQAKQWLSQNPNDPRAQAVRDKIAQVEGQNKQQNNQQQETQEPTNVQQPEQKQGWFQDILDSANKRADKVGAIENSDQSGGSKSLQIFGQGAGLGADIIGTVMGHTLSAVTPDFIEKPVTEAIGSAMTNILTSAPAQTIAQNWEKFKQEHPELAGNIGVVGNVVNLGASLYGAKAFTSAAGKVVPVVAKTAAKGAEIVGKGVGGTGKFAVSQASGITRQGITNIVENPQAFTKEAMASADRLSLGNKVKEAISGRIAQLSETGQAYEGVRAGGSVVIPKATYSDVLNKFGLKIKNGKIITTAESVPISSADKAAIEGFLSQYGETNLSGNAFLNARQSLSQLGKYEVASGKTTYASKIARKFRQAMDEHGKAQLQGLAEADAKYAPEVKQLNQLRKDYFTPQGELKDGALSKIANLGGKGKDIVLQRLEQIVPEIRQDINVVKTIEELQGADFKVGAYIKGGLVGGAAGGGNPVAALVGAIMANPAISVPIIRTYGMVKGIVTDGIIGKLQRGASLAKSELKILDDAIITASGKAEAGLKSYVKNIRPGLNIKNVSGGKAGYSKKDSGAIRSTTLAEEAKKYKTAEEFVKAQEARSVSNVAFHGTQAKEIRGVPNKTRGTMGKAFYLADSSDNALDFGADANRKIGKEVYRVSGVHQKVNKFTFDLTNLKIKNFKNKAEFDNYINGKDASSVFNADGYDGAYIIRDGNYAIYNPEKLREIKTKSQLTDIWKKAHKK